MKNSETITQEQVTEFYDKIVFPSRTSHKLYEDLVPSDLSGLKVGDFGCGQSLFIDVFKKYKYDAVFLDISQNVLNTIDYGQRIKASLTNIPLEDDFMDVIFCIGVVHHIPEMEKAIFELIRVLKRGGKLYLGVYTNRCVHAALRKTYDYFDNVFLKGVVYTAIELLVWLKNRKNGLHFRSVDHYKRVDDLLKTPLVRYLPARYYARILTKCGCNVIRMKRISSMNVLLVEKGKTHI